MSALPLVSESGSDRPLDTSAVVVLSASDLARQAIEHLLARAGVFPSADPTDGSEGGSVTAVIVGDDESAWRQARELGARVVLVTETDLAESQVTRAYLDGADAVLHADSDPSELLFALNMVAAGGTVLTPDQARAVLDAARKRLKPQDKLVLTRREQEILLSIERGESVKQTARYLGIAVKTVENIQSRLYRKLGVRNRAQAITRVHTLGLLDQD